jgi:hypothetical protein
MAHEQTPIRLLFMGIRSRWGGSQVYSPHSLNEIPPRAQTGRICGNYEIWKGSKYMKPEKTQVKEVGNRLKGCGGRSAQPQEFEESKE